MRLFGLAGDQCVRHSFSQKYFKTKFFLESTDADYYLFPCEDAKEISALFEENPALWGLNVTMPYKIAVIPYLDFLSKEVLQVGSLNVIKAQRQDGSIKLHGYNTDIYGFEQALKPHLAPRYKRALVLGNGGSAKSVCYVLQSLGIDYTIVSGKQSTHTVRYGELTPQIMKDHLLIVNTTPLGMFPQTGALPDIPYQALTDEHLLFDLIYNPQETLFLSQGKSYGAKTVGGLEMFIAQAEKSWQIWNNLEIL